MVKERTKKDLSGFAFHGLFELDFMSQVVHYVRCSEVIYVLNSMKPCVIQLISDKGTIVESNT